MISAYLAHSAGELVLGEAGVDRAGLDAGVAVDALVGVDVEHLDAVVVGLVGRRVDAVHRTDLDARVVLGADAGLGDDVGHSSALIRNVATARSRRRAGVTVVAQDHPLRLPGDDSADGRHRARRVASCCRCCSTRGEQVRCLVRETRAGWGRTGSTCRSPSATSPSSDLLAAPGAARRRHGGPPRGDDPRPAARHDRGAQRAGDVRLLRAAERAGVERFVFFSALGRARASSAPASFAPRRSPSEAVARRRDRLDGLRPLDRLRARRSLGHPDGALLAPAGAADRRLGRRPLPADRAARRRGCVVGGAQRRRRRAALRARRPRDAQLRRDRRDRRPRRRAAASAAPLPAAASSRRVCAPPS